jgi:hypothetical protein
MLLDPAAPSRLEGLNSEQAIDRLRQRDPNPTREGWPIEARTSVAQPRCARRPPSGPRVTVESGGNGTYPDRWQRF